MFLDLNSNTTCHNCSDPSGIAFKLVYQIGSASTGLFSTLLTIPKKGINSQFSCPLDSFMFMNSKHDVEAVSIVSSCLGINLGLFPIHDLETHIYIFNKCKIGSLCTVLNYSDANIILWSIFPYSLFKIRLGHFLDLLPVSNSNRTGLIATFSKAHSHFKVKLPNIQVSLFDTTFKSAAIINEQQLTFLKSIKMFNKYRVKLNGKINQALNWKKAPIEVHGRFHNNQHNIPKLLCYQITKVIDVLHKRSKVEANSAETVYNRALSRYIKAITTYNEYKIAMNKSNYTVKQMEDEYKKVNNTLYLITERLQRANNKIKILQKKIDSLCTIKQCPDVCVPKQVCKECKRSITIPVQGTCIRPCNKAENITVVTGSERVTRWEYRPQQTCKTYPSCYVFTCVSTTRCSTYFISKPVHYFKYKTETRLVNTITNCDKPCSETVASAPVTATCCTNFTCSSTKDDVDCLSQNQQCTQMRKVIYSNLNDAEKNATKILQSFDEAKRNLTVIKLRLLRLKANYILIEKEFNKSKRAYTDATSTLEIAVVSFETIRNKNQLAKLEKVKNSSICGFTPSSFLQIKSVSFDVNINKESPTLLAVNVAIFVASYNVTVTETIYIDFNKINTSLKQGAVIIIEKLVLSQNIPSKRQSRSAVNESVTSINEIYFQRKCADVKNILDYIKGLNTSIFTIAMSAISSVSSLNSNVIELSKLINYSSKIFNEEVTINYQHVASLINRNLTNFNSNQDDVKTSQESNELMKLMQEHLLSSQELENELYNNLYQSWQAKMEDIHNQTKSAAGFPCTGFTGCLQKVVDTLNDLISDIPLDVDSILGDIFDAAQNLMDLGLLQNYSIISAVSNTEKIYNIASNPVISDYWCASVPRIIVHPEKYINVTENATIQASCKAEKEKFTTYQWKKNDIQLPNQKNSTLVLTNVTLSDSGNYTCVVTNQVGSTISFDSLVEVQQFPSFFVEPTNVIEYLGNLNGAIFRCNASGFPNPGYKWYFQRKGTESFTELPNSDQNELIITPPLLKDEGSYYCKAFIGNVSIHSRVANLTVLHSTVIQVVQTVYLNFSYLNKMDKTVTQSPGGSGSEFAIDPLQNDFISGDFSGSGEIGSGLNRNISITPFTNKLALEKNVINVLNTLVPLGSATVGNVSINYVTPYNLALSFTLYSHSIDYSETSFSKINQIAAQAIIEWRDTWHKLQEVFSMSGFVLSDNEYEYESAPSSLKIDMLQFVCPAGKGISSTNNLICGKVYHIVLTYKNHVKLTTLLIHVCMYIHMYVCFSSSHSHSYSTIPLGTCKEG